MAEVNELPELPDIELHRGYDWMDELDDTPWVPVPNWGQDGWNLGQWPYVIVCICSPGSGARAFGVVTYVEGDLERHAFRSRDEMIRQVDVIAASYWRLSDRMPEVPPIGPVLEEHTGPYSWERADAARTTRADMDP